jgi:O-acetyl-ADP-ribose deacetylase (regulator of RNase III)
MITYIKGDATKPKGNGQKYILHICNNKGGWGRGFVLALSRKWKEPEEEYRAWHKAHRHSTWGDFTLGNIQVVKVSDGVSVINMIAQRGYGKFVNGVFVPPIDYAALESCLIKVKDFAKNKDVSLHGPKFGSGLAAGNWNAIESIIDSVFDKQEIKIYEL